MAITLQQQLEAERLVSKAAAELLKYSGVTSVGAAEKRKGGRLQKRPCILVTVKKKLPPNNVHCGQLVPPMFDGLETDVVETGYIRPLSTPRRASPREDAEPPTESFDPTLRHRPIRPGTSIGHPTITSGTLGMICQDAADRTVILSNWHVLVGEQGKIGDGTIQPGKAYGGSAENDLVGSVQALVPLGGSSGRPCLGARTVAGLMNAAYITCRRRTRLVAQTAVETSDVDCAVSAVLPDVPYNLDIPTIGTPHVVVDAGVGALVRKFGATTERTNGRVLATNVTLPIQYSETLTILFTGQTLAESVDNTSFSAGGDSGSVICTMAWTESVGVVGLLFAGSATVTVFNRATRVFEALNLHLWR